MPPPQKKKEKKEKELVKYNFNGQVVLLTIEIQETIMWCLQKASGGGEGEFDDVDIQQLNWVEGNRKVISV